MTDIQDQVESDILCCRILLIGSETADLELMQRTLQDAGYESVTVVDDPERSAPRPHLWRPDLMVLDLSVPDGPAMSLLTELLAAVPSQEAIPLLVLVADSSPDDRRCILRHGANDVLAKPLVPEELLARVSASLTARILRHRERRLTYLLDQAQSERASAAEADFLRAVLNSMQEGVLACDGDGWLVFANAAASRLGLDQIGAGQIGAGQGPRLAPGLLRSGQGTLLSADDDPLRRAWNGEPVVGQEIAVDDSRRGPRVLAANANQILVDPGTRLGAVAVLHDITETHRLLQSLRRQVLHDDLTGLPNRVLFLDLLERAVAKAQRDHRPAAVMVLDVRCSAGADDALDTAAQESVLSALAQRLLVTLRPGDTSARLGDGFGVLCAPPVSEANARQIAERLRVGLCRPVPVDGRQVTPELHLGITIFRGAEVPPEQVLQNAQAAALEAAHLGGSRHLMLECLPRQAFLEQLDIVADLRDALPGGELSAHYQSMVDLVSKDVVGVEALVRWNRSGQAPVPPAQFIPVAARHGLLSQIGRWILMAACHQFVVWQQAHLLDDRFAVSVNVSAHELMAPGWIDQVDQVLQTTQIDPRRVILEIATPSLGTDLALTLSSLEALRSRGIRLALDDVDDTAEASLADLLGLPVEMIKLDRGLVATVVDDQAGTAAVAGLIDLSHRLGKVVVAEGVETDDEASALVALGCDLAQGHYFSRPLPADRMTVLLRPSPSTA